MKPVAQRTVYLLDVDRERLSQLLQRLYAEAVGTTVLFQVMPPAGRCTTVKILTPYSSDARRFAYIIEHTAV